jgi:hypothetical protein
MMRADIEIAEGDLVGGRTRSKALATLESSSTKMSPSRAFRKAPAA